MTDSLQSLKIFWQPDPPDESQMVTGRNPLTRVVGNHMTKLIADTPVATAGGQIQRVKEDAMKKEPAKVIVPHRDLEPNYYCVKTTYHHDGKIESKILTEENTELLMAFESPGKPLDGVFETPTATIYYTYHDNYEDAARQVEATGVHNRQHEQTVSMISFRYSCRHYWRFSFCLKSYSTRSVFPS